MVEKFKPDILFVRRNGDLALSGFGYEFGDEGFVLVIAASHIRVFQQSAYYSDPDDESYGWGIDI